MLPVGYVVAGERQSLLSCLSPAVKHLPHLTPPSKADHPTNTPLTPKFEPNHTNTLLHLIKLAFTFVSLILY